MSDLTLKDAILGMLSARANGPDQYKIHASDFKKVSDLFIGGFMSSFHFMLLLIVMMMVMMMMILLIDCTYLAWTITILSLNVAPVLMTSFQRSTNPMTNNQ